MNPHTNPDAYKANTFSKPTFNIVTNLVSSIPIRETKCSSHGVNISYPDASAATVTLQSPDSYEGDRDYIVRYRLSEDKIETGISLFKAGDENFFLMMMQPPKRVKAEHIPPREYIFIVDVSGSMRSPTARPSWAISTAPTTSRRRSTEGPISTRRFISLGRECPANRSHSIG